MPFSALERARLPLCCGTLRAGLVDLSWQRDGPDASSQQEVEGSWRQCCQQGSLACSSGESIISSTFAQALCWGLRILCCVEWETSVWKMEENMVWSIYMLKNDIMDERIKDNLNQDRYTVFMDWNTQHYKDDNSPQISLQI